MESIQFKNTGLECRRTHFKKCHSMALQYTVLNIYRISLVYVYIVQYTVYIFLSYSEFPITVYTILALKFTLSF